MPKVITFNGRRIVEPGAYAQILGGDNQSADVATTGNVMIIDLGTGANSGAGYGYGSGVNGSNNSGVKSVYAFDRLDDFQNAVRGGILWDVAQYLFNPSKNPTVKGCQRLFLVKAATTTSGTTTYTFTGGGSNGGAFTFVTQSEGTGVNGVLTSSVLTLGFASKMVAGTIDAAKFKIQFSQGTFKGLDVNSVPYDGITQANSVPIILTESPEFSNIADLINWAKTDSTFNSYFKLTVGTVTGTGVVDAADLAAYPSTNLIAGATEVYNSSDLDSVLTSIREVDNTFFLATLTGDNAQDVKNGKILTHILTQSEFKKMLYIGGGNDSTKFTQTNGSIPSAAFYNSAYVKVVHSGIRVSTTSGLGYKDLSSFYNAAIMLGREAGNEPQTPSTFKDVSVIGVTHELTQTQRETALLSGVQHMRNVPGLGFVINQDITTLQKNDQQVYPDGSSPDGSVMRIALEINKELVINARQQFVGKNVATASPADIKAFTESYLKSKTASKTQDNLILSFKDISVRLVGSDYHVTYSFVPNGPVNRLFFTGIMFQVSLTA